MTLSPSVSNELIYWLSNFGFNFSNSLLYPNYIGIQNFTTSSLQVSKSETPLKSIKWRNKPGVGFCGNIERWLVLAGLTIIHCCPFVLNWGDSLEPCWCWTRDLCRGVVGSWCCLTGDLGSWGAGRTPTGDWGRAWRRGTGVGAWGKATVVTTVVGPLQPWGPPEKVTITILKYKNCQNHTQKFCQNRVIVSTICDRSI